MFGARSFLNDVDLNAQALSWATETANVRIHRTTGERPLVRFDRDERVLLRPLPLKPIARRVLAAYERFANQGL